MMPLVEKLEKEAGVKVEKYEVWHDEENAKKWKSMTRAFVAAYRFSSTPIPKNSSAAKLHMKN